MLSEVQRPDNQKVGFTYDALGRRLSKKFRNTTTKWLWDGNIPLHEWKENSQGSILSNSTVDDDGVITWVFEENSFIPTAKLRGDKKYSILADHLGTPTSMYNEEGETTWERSLDSNGKAIKGNNASCPFTFQGQYYDKEINLAYNRFRYYDADDGRYISKDPIGLASGEYGFYNYVGDSNGWVDEFGLYVAAFRRRSKSSVKAMRKRFQNRGRKKFLKRLGKDVEGLKARGFTDDQIKIIKSGNVPTDYVVHHIKPIYRGGNNSFNNLYLMKSIDHSTKGKYGPLHDYPEGANPFGAQYN